MKQKKEKSEHPHFKFIIDHIDETWFKLKGFHYPFAGKDFRDLKNIVRIFQQSGTLALWDCFIESNNSWVVESGYSLGAFGKCLTWLVDVPGWKSKAATYEKKFMEESENKLLEELPLLKIIKIA